MRYKIFLIKFKIILVFALLVNNELSAIEYDTLSAKMKEVSVTANRILSNAAIKYNAFQVLDAEFLEQRNSWGLSEALSVSTGIQINDYGGLGGLKTVSMRGTTSRQNVIMIDGVKVNSSQSGISDLSVIPVSQFNNIEVIRGGLSAIYGGSAIGGVINLANLDFSGNRYMTSLQYGSFDEYFTSASAEFGNDDLNESVFIEYKNSSGNYPFKFGNNALLNRCNSDFEMFSFSSLTRFKFSDWQFSGRLIGNIVDRGIPGPVISELRNNLSESRLTEDRGLLIMTAMKQIDEASSVYFGINTNINSYNNVDSNFLGSNIKNMISNFTNRDIAFVSRFSFPINIFNCRIGLESGFSDLRGNHLDQSLDDYVKRYNYAVSANAESEIRINNFVDIDYFFGLRFDEFSDFYGTVSGFAGILAKFDGIPIQLRGQASHNFRPPAFNEMYYLNYGNSDLIPEKSVSFNSGFVYNFDEHINCSIDGFYIDTDDQIVSVPKSQTSWTAKNIGRVVSQGIEASVHGEFFGKKLSADLSYTFQDVRDISAGSINEGMMIVYVPPEIISMSVVYKFWDAMTGFFGRYSNFYYTLPDNSLGSILRPYAIIDVFVGYKIEVDDLSMDLRIDGKNILDRQYAVILNYPMPGRYFRAGITFNY